jgi:carboxyl-terminal processing protease
MIQARWFLALGVAGGFIGAGAWYLGRAHPRAADPPKVAGSRLFESVFSHVRTFAVDSLNDQELYRRAASGVIDELDDPYAVLLLSGQSRFFPNDSASPQGLFLDRRDGSVVIVATVRRSPADAAGVRSGDLLLGVDSIPVDPTRLDRVARLLDGKAGTSLILRLRRPGARGVLAIALVRGSVPPEGALVSEGPIGGVGRLSIRRFVPGLANSVRAGLQALRNAGARSLVLDLRGAVGGTLSDGIALADLFLDAGMTIAVSRGRPAADSTSYTDSTPSPFDSLPMAVLVDAGTAGAGEVVAGALQDHDRAAVLGATTFGRGVTQSIFSLDGNASLRLTTALWLTPSGRQIQRPPRPADGDSVPRPKLKSEGGRVLLGGGGIVPDRLVLDSGATDVVLAAARVLLARAGSARAVLALVAEH